MFIIHIELNKRLGAEFSFLADELIYNFTDIFLPNDVKTLGEIIVLLYKFFMELKDIVHGEL